MKNLSLQYVSKKKIIFITVLFVLAVLSATYAELYAKPNLLKDDKALKRTTKELNETKEQNLKVEDELIYMRQKKEDFRLLERAGFFEKQNREIIQKSVDDAMRASGITGGGFRVSPPACMVNDDFRDSNFVLLASPVTVTIEAYEDLSVYKFVDLFVQTLPGYVVMESIEVVRTRDVTRNLLQEIGAGNKVALMTSRVLLTWYTVVSKDSMECTVMGRR